MRNTTATSRMNCPGCSAAMSTLALEGHVGAAIDIDICAACQVFWFDRRESLQLSPGSTLKLFERIGEHAASRTSSLSGRAALPTVPVAARPHQRPTAQHAVSVLAVHARARPAHHLVRFPAREALHQAAVGAAAGRAAAARTDDQLLELRRSDRPDHPLVVLALRLADLDAGPEAGRAGDRRAPGRRRAEGDRPCACRSSWPAPGARSIAAFASIEGNPTWWKDAAGTGIVEAGLGAVARWLRKRAT